MKKVINSPYFMAAGFAILNVTMYFTISKFWIGGSSFLPMVGELGEKQQVLLRVHRQSRCNCRCLFGSFHFRRVPPPHAKKERYRSCHSGRYFDRDWRDLGSWNLHNMLCYRNAYAVCLIFSLGGRNIYRWFSRL